MFYPAGCSYILVFMMNLQLAYLPYKRRDMLLDDENCDPYVPVEGYNEATDDSSKEDKKNKKHGLLNWFKSRV